MQPRTNANAEITPASVLDYRFSGLIVATSIIIAWLGLLVTSLFVIQLTRDTWWWPVIAIPIQTFLNVGLFITAHDAMHQTLAPKNRALNDFVGRLSLMLYALFSFDRLKANHRRHHDRPASAEDPDHHDPTSSSSFWPWYLRFMARYSSRRQWIGMPIVFCLLWLGFGVSPINLFVLWVIPAWSSSLQLFYFGTYLPHRETPTGFADHHRASTNNFSPWVSFLTCYHFGKHWEHHAFPYIPWWKLGAMTHQGLLTATGR